MSLYEFAANSPWLTFFLAFIVAKVIIYPMKILNRWIRHRNIAIAGWPPAHLDADGDWKKEDTAQSDIGGPNG